MKYNGVVVVKTCFKGSKSEGRYAFLDTDRTEYRLFRKDVPSANDVFFQPFDGKRVEVEGTVTDGWLSVDSIYEEQNGAAAFDGCAAAERQEPETETGAGNEVNTQQKDIANEENL